MLLTTLPEPLAWHVPAPAYTLADDTLSLSAGPRTDLFIDPLGGSEVSNAPCLLSPVRSDCTLQARVTVDFQDTFDAGVLLVYQHAASWAKLCLEYTPQHQPSIVSVVTKGISDDANAYTLEAHSTLLRIAKLGRAYAFHHSVNGHSWQLIRLFALDDAPTWFGFLAQAPRGQGCTVRFSELHYQARRLSHLRSGE